MLASKYRITNSKEIQNVKDNGTLLNRDHYGVLVFKRDDDKPVRFGFIISKKVNKLAVQRNRIKRALREAARYNTSYVKNGYDMLFLAKESIVTQSTDSTMRDVEVFLRGFKGIKSNKKVKQRRKTK